MQSIALLRSAAVILCLEIAVGLPAQQAQPAAPAATPVPRLVRFNTVLRPVDLWKGEVSCSEQ